MKKNAIPVYLIIIYWCLILPYILQNSPNEIEWRLMNNNSCDGCSCDSVTSVQYHVSCDLKAAQYMHCGTKPQSLQRALLFALAEALRLFWLVPDVEWLQLAYRADISTLSGKKAVRRRYVTSVNTLLLSLWSQSIVIFNKNLILFILCFRRLWAMIG